MKRPHAHIQRVVVQRPLDAVGADDAFQIRRLRRLVKLFALVYVDHFSLFINKNTQKRKDLRLRTFYFVTFTFALFSGE